MAKPENWDTLTPEQKRAEAQTLLQDRGRVNHLIASALSVATEALRKQEHPLWSDLGDMEILQEVFRTPWDALLPPFPR